MSNNFIVDSELIYEKLDVKATYAVWIKNKIKRLKFQENTDYQVVLTSMKKNYWFTKEAAQKLIDYIAVLNAYNSF